MLLSSCSSGSSSGFSGFIPIEEGIKTIPELEYLLDPLTIELKVPGDVDYTKVPLYVYLAEVAEVTSVLNNEPIAAENAKPNYLTFYNLHITYNYTTEEEVDLYIETYYRGTEQKIAYGDILPQEGERFILAENNVEIMETFGMGQIYRIIDVDGEEYALPYKIMTELCFENGVTPPKEYGTVYTKEHEDEIMAYLRKNDIANPKVKMIYKLTDFIPQLIDLQSEIEEWKKSREPGDYSVSYNQSAHPEGFDKYIIYDHTKGYDE